MLRFGAVECKVMLQLMSSEAAEVQIFFTSMTDRLYPRCCKSNSQQHVPDWKLAVGSWSVAFRRQLAHDGVKGAFRENMDIVRCFGLTMALVLCRARLREERGSSILQTLQLHR